jgi:hypothetical protein
MKIKFLLSIASSAWGYAPGQIADIDKDIAEKWIASGIAEAVIEEKPEAPKAPKAK